MSDFEKLSQEQQRYTQLRVLSKHLYQAKDLSKAIQDNALSSESEPLAIAQLSNQLHQTLDSAARFVYAQQKGIEHMHPEFKERAIEHAKAHAQEKTQTPSQTL